MPINGIFILFTSKNKHFEIFNNIQPLLKNNHKQHEERFERHQAAYGRTDDPSQVVGHTQDAIAFGALLFGQEVCQHGIIGRAINIGKEANKARERVQDGERIGQPERQRTEGAEDQAKEDNLAPPEPIGQRAADHAADQPKGGPDPQDNASLGHADVEFLGDVKGEKWEEQVAAEVINEGDQHNNPEPGREFLIDFT